MYTRVPVAATHCITLQHAVRDSLPCFASTHVYPYGYTATHCSTLQHSATHCNTVQHSATQCNTVQHTATQCNTLQHSAAHCNTLQHSATQCNTMQHTATHWTCLPSFVRAKEPCTIPCHDYCNTLQHTATHCNTTRRERACACAHAGSASLPSFASTLQPFAIPCHDYGRHTATRCNILHHNTERAHARVRTCGTCLQYFASAIEPMQSHATINATHCNTLQHTATHCNTLQHTATHCNTLQHTATRHRERVRAAHVGPAFLPCFASALWGGYGQ